MHASRLSLFKLTQICAHLHITIWRKISSLNNVIYLAFFFLYFLKIFMKYMYFLSYVANSKCRFHCSGGDWRNRASGVRVEATACRRIPEANGRTVRMCFVYSIVSQICRSGGRSFRQVSVFFFSFSFNKYTFIRLVYRWNVFRARLFRESCVYHRGNYVKDLNKLGRDLQKIVIVDNSPASYIFHPDNAVSTFLSKLL